MKTRLLKKLLSTIAIIGCFLLGVNNLNDWTGAGTIRNGKTISFTAPSSQTTYTVTINDIYYYDRLKVLINAETDNAENEPPYNRTQPLHEYKYNDWKGNSFMNYYNWGTTGATTYGFTDKNVSLKVTGKEVIASVTVKATRPHPVTGDPVDIDPKDFAFVIAGTESVDQQDSERYGLGVPGDDIDATIVPVEFMKSTLEKFDIRIYDGGTDQKRYYTKPGQTTRTPMKIRELIMRAGGNDPRGGGVSGDVIFAATKSDKFFVRLSGNGAQHFAMGILDLVDMGDAPNGYENTTDEDLFAKHVAKPGLKRERELQFNDPNNADIGVGDPVGVNPGYDNLRYINFKGDINSQN